MARGGANLIPRVLPQKKEVNTLLDDIIKHMTPNRAFERHYSEILSIVNKILPYFTDFSQLFAMVRS